MRMRTAALILASTLLAAGCGEKDEPEPQPAEWEGETIELGSIFSTTGIGSRRRAAAGPGVELAIEEVNEDGRGQRRAISSRSSSRRRLRSATSVDGDGELVNEDEVLAVLGPTFSNSAAEARPDRGQARHPGARRLQYRPRDRRRLPVPLRARLPRLARRGGRDPGQRRDIRRRRRLRRRSWSPRSTIPSASRTAAIAAKAFEENGIEVAWPSSSSPRSRRAAAGDRAGDQARRPDVIFFTTSSGEVAATRSRSRARPASRATSSAATPSTSRSPRAAAGRRWRGRSERRGLVRGQRLGPGEHLLHRRLPRALRTRSRPVRGPGVHGPEAARRGGRDRRPRLRRRRPPTARRSPKRSPGSRSHAARPVQLHPRSRRLAADLGRRDGRRGGYDLVEELQPE